MESGYIALAVAGAAVTGLFVTGAAVVMIHYFRRRPHSRMKLQDDESYMAEQAYDEAFAEQIAGCDGGAAAAVAHRLRKRRKEETQDIWPPLRPENKDRKTSFKSVGPRGGYYYEA